MYNAYLSNFVITDKLCECGMFTDACELFLEWWWSTSTESEPASSIECTHAESWCHAY